MGLIRTSRHFNCMDTPCLTDIHLIIVDPCHRVTRLIIKDADAAYSTQGLIESLLRSGVSTGVCARDRQWNITSPEDLHWMQHVEREAGGSNDLSPAVRLLKPPISSTGFNCIWPYVIKIGWWGKKRWGVIFKCLTTRCVHSDLLSNIGVDTFLLALKHFISCRGTPSKVIQFSEQEKNFRGPA